MATPVAQTMLRPVMRIQMEVWSLQRRSALENMSPEDDHKFPPGSLERLLQDRLQENWTSWACEQEPKAKRLKVEAADTKGQLSYVCQLNVYEDMPHIVLRGFEFRPISPPRHQKALKMPRLLMRNLERNQPTFPRPSYCWLLEPHSEVWEKLEIPTIGKSQLKGNMVHSVGSSGLVVAWGPEEETISVGNPVTQNWEHVPCTQFQQRAVKYCYLDAGPKCRCTGHLNPHIRTFVAVELLLDETTKHPLKLLRFAIEVTRLDPILFRQFKRFFTLCTFSFSFATRRWSFGPSISLDIPSQGARDVHRYTCTYDGVVFFLIRNVDAHKFMVVAYSMALCQFAIAVPWASAQKFVHANWRHSLLMVDPKLLRLPQANIGGSSSRTTNRKKKEKEKPSTSTDLQPGWLWMVRGLLLVLARETEAMGPQIEALQYDQKLNVWKMPVEAFEELLTCRKPYQDQMVCKDHMEGPSRRPKVFIMAPAEAGAVYVAAYSLEGNCTHVGHYDLVSREYWRVKTPDLLQDHLLHENKDTGKNSFVWKDFSLHSFVPCFT